MAPTADAVIPPMSPVPIINERIGGPGIDKIIWKTPLKAGTLVATLPKAIVLPVAMVDDNDSFAPWFNTSFALQFVSGKEGHLVKSQQ